MLWPWQRLDMQATFGIELVAVVVVIFCCFVDPPFTPSIQGTETYIDAAEIEIDGKSIRYLDQPAVPPVGSMVLIAYQDEFRGQVVLSVTVNPDSPGSTTYSTHAGQVFQRWLWLSYLALFGLIAGLVVALVIAARLWVLGRRNGVPARGAIVAIAPFTLLGFVGLAAAIFWLPGSRVVIWAALVIAVLASSGTLMMTVTSNRRGEVQLALGKRGQVLAGVASATWIVGWIVFVGFKIYEFGREPLIIPSY